MVTHTHAHTHTRTHTHTHTHTHTLCEYVTVFMCAVGVVKYIGRLHDDPLNATYIGVELDAPSECQMTQVVHACARSYYGYWHTLMTVGENDGTYRKQRYFDGRPYHGVFIKGSDIQCVTLRTVSSSGLEGCMLRGYLVHRCMSLSCCVRTCVCAAHLAQ